ncbi:MAG: hypothetical protein A4E55_00724 [Pelotomaculum sp. PtaU1.Bin035]|nr:MAG: hypothetical protein A4E55_00724 [Pelotomaculum sp. PtaU1.Bin035]
MDNKQIIENYERISVLNGEGRIKDMAVFLAYRKLVKMLAASSSTHKTIKEGQGK